MYAILVRIKRPKEKPTCCFGEVFTKIAKHYCTEDKYNRNEVLKIRFCIKWSKGHGDLIDTALAQTLNHAWFPSQSRAGRAPYLNVPTTSRSHVSPHAQSRLGSKFKIPEIHG